MNRIRYIAFILSVFILSSCNDWLEVEPKTEIKSNKMFENETGFRDALTGCYLQMTEPSLYGRENTICFFDVLAHQYEMETTNPYNRLLEYRYENYSSTIDAIWTGTYKIIANLNMLIEMLEEKGDILPPTSYAVIKGEAYGLRAYLHFELLRMFGWGDLVNTPTNADKLCIPYVTRYHKTLTAQSTVKEVLQYIHQDLNLADTLLIHYDPISRNAKEDDYDVNDDDLFFKNRASRFNYYAVKATEARVCMWEGKWQEALDILEPTFIKDAPFSWVDPERSINVEEKNRDLSYTVEHIFYLNVQQMYEELRPYVEYFETDEGYTIVKNDDYFYTNKDNGELLYEIATGIGLSDYRYTRGLDKTEAQHWLFLKFYEPENSESSARNRMPLIRKPEMFYYAAECYNRLGNAAKAVETLNEVRLARGILYEKNLSSELSHEEIAEEILKEWRKEFIGEGQMFFYYKRLNLTIPNSTVAPGDDLFILPLPDSEVEIGGREDYEDDENEK